MNKLESIWYHEAAPGSGKLASSHIAVLFCAMAKNGMIVGELLEMEFEGIPNPIDESISPMDYLIAYTDGQLYDYYVVPAYREAMVSFFDSNDMLISLFEGTLIEGLEFSSTEEVYTLECNWYNVHKVTEWLATEFN